MLRNICSSNSEGQSQTEISLELQFWSRNLDEEAFC